MRKTFFTLCACALISASGFAQNLVTNGGFELPDDGVKHLFITERAGWFSDDATENHNGTEYSTDWEGNYYQYCVNTAGSIYQPIDIITEESATYNVSYLYSIGWNDDAGNDTVYSIVYFSHYAPGNIKNRTLIDSIATDVTSLLWNRQLVTASFKLPANVAYEGDSLVIEFATRVENKDNVSNNTWANMDSIVVKKIVTTQVLKNGGFELPDDGVKHLFITERTNWYSDDATENHNGTEYSTEWEGNYYQYCVNTAGTIYQPVDKITKDSATYDVSYLYSIGWNDDAGNDTVYSVVYFSHYTPGNIKNRTIIDSVATDVTSLLWNRQLVTTSFKLPANTAYEGDSLVIEFATRVENKDKVSNNTWTNMDSIVVLKTGVYTGEMAWKEFNVAKIVDATNITSSSDFSVSGKVAWDSKYIYLKLDVTDDSIYAPDNSYMNDNFEIYFDMNNVKIPSYPRGQANWPSSYDGLPGCYQLRLIPGIPFDTVNSGVMGFAIQNYEVTEAGYAYDVKFIIDSLLEGFVPVVGKVIGFDVLASDNDNDPYYRDQLSYYAPSGSIWCDAAMWGTIKFAEQGGFYDVYDETKPSVVTNMAVVLGNNQVLLSWDPATDNIVVEQYIILSNDVIIDTIYAQLSDNSYVIKGITLGDYTFSVIAVDIAGNQSDKASILFSNVSGVNNTEISKFNIYPNPSTSIISLNNDVRVKLEVFNSSGQMVILKSVEAFEKVDISALGSGIYSARITENSNSSFLKLIKR